MSASVLLLSLSLFSTQEPGKIDEAVKKGVTYLQKQQASLLLTFDFQRRRFGHRELVLWTMINAAVPPTDPVFKALFDDMMKDKLESTYAVALQAMILEFLDRVRFQPRIAQCAKFLVDNQGPGGYWSYGSPSIYVEDIEFGKGPKPGPFVLPNAPQNSKVTRKISIKKDRDGEGRDSSNTFFATLGLRACHDAGIVFETKVIELAARNWRETRIGEKDAGWSYEFGEGPVYPSATAGAIASNVVYGHILGSSRKKDPLVMAAMSGLSKSWNAAEMTGMNGDTTKALHYHALYTVGVAAVLVGEKKLDGHDWHAEGSKLVLEQQNADGSWGSNAVAIPLPQGGLRGATYVSNALWDTCFAILFLRHGIQPIPDPAPKKK